MRHNVLTPKPSSRKPKNDLAQSYADNSVFFGSFLYRARGHLIYSKFYSVCSKLVFLMYFIYLNVKKLEKKLVKIFLNDIRNARCASYQKFFTHAPKI